MEYFAFHIRKKALCKASVHLLRPTDMGASLLKKSFQAYYVYVSRVYMPSHNWTVLDSSGHLSQFSPSTRGDLRNLAQVISLITGVSTAEPSCQPRVYPQQEGKPGKNIQLMVNCLLIKSLTQKSFYIITKVIEFIIGCQLYILVLISKLCSFPFMSNPTRYKHKDFIGSCLFKRRQAKLQRLR